MICIHCTSLATVVTSLVCVLIIHIIRNPNLSENKWMDTHILKALISKRLKLVTQAVSNCSLPNLNPECRRKILSTKDADDINVVQPVPDLG